MFLTSRPMYFMAICRQSIQYFNSNTNGAKLRFIEAITFNVFTNVSYALSIKEKIHMNYLKECPS